MATYPPSKYVMRKFINMINENLDTHIEKLVRHAFEKVGIEINYNNYAVTFDEDTREVEVKIEGEEITLDALIRLTASGLAEDSSTKGYRVRHVNDYLAIVFTASSLLDGATIE